MCEDQARLAAAGMLLWVVRHRSHGADLHVEGQLFQHLTPFPPVSIPDSCDPTSTDPVPILNFNSPYRNQPAPTLLQRQSNSQLFIMDRIKEVSLPFLLWPHPTATGGLEG